MVGDFEQFEDVAFFYGLDAVGKRRNSMTGYLNFDLEQACPNHSLWAAWGPGQL